DLSNASEALWGMDFGDFIADACSYESLDMIIDMEADELLELRHRLSRLLSADNRSDERYIAEDYLIPMDEVVMVVPHQIGDYTDFYASIYHATNIGRIFRPGQPLMPNYKWIPIGYHGRASSIAISGTPIRRPAGQTKDDIANAPSFGPSKVLDYELE